MSFWKKPIDSVTHEDIQRLVDESVRESISIEYKRELDLKEESKSKFVKAITAFANTEGGTLLYGIEESDATPHRIGLLRISDKELLSIKNVLRDKVEPPIQGIQFKQIAIPDNDDVLIINIPKSSSAPHRNEYDRHFYKRIGPSSEQLKVHQLRMEFLGSETLEQNIVKFRDERLKFIRSKVEQPNVVVHIYPSAAYDSDFTMNIPIIKANRQLLKPIYCSADTEKIDQDGIIWRGSKFGGEIAYTRVFTDCRIEAVESYILCEFVRQQASSMSKKKDFINTSLLEFQLIKHITLYLEALKKMQINPPIYVMVSLLGVRDLKIKNHSILDNQRDASISNDDLQLNKIVINSYEQNISQALRPIFNEIWNAAGWEQAVDYDENGYWKHEQQVESEIKRIIEEND